MYIMVSNPSRYEQMENVRQCRPGKHGGERMNATDQNGLRTINKIYGILHSYRISFLHYLSPRRISMTPLKLPMFHDSCAVRRMQPRTARREAAWPDCEITRCTIHSLTCPGEKTIGYIKIEWHSWQSNSLPSRNALRASGRVPSPSPVDPGTCAATSRCRPRTRRGGS